MGVHGRNAKLERVVHARFRDVVRPRQTAPPAPHRAMPHRCTRMSYTCRRRDIYRRPILGAPGILPAISIPQKGKRRGRFSGLDGSTSSALSRRASLLADHQKHDSPRPVIDYEPRGSGKGGLTTQEHYTRYIEVKMNLYARRPRADSSRKRNPRRTFANNPTA